ncbi:hypothetical protein M8J75_000117 [Diaphorina citri]|nr:hypothetical protein M8J75_000117 [Diaphorina citri]
MRLKSLSTSIPLKMNNFDPNISLIYGEESSKMMACVKSLLILFNVICLGTGIVLIYSGISVLGIYSDHAHFTQAQNLAPPTFLVMVGVLVATIAFMGIVGVLKESVCMILSFSFVLGIIFMFELSISLTGLVYQTEIRDILSHSMSRALQVYPRDPVAMQAVDTLQYQLSCCGVQSSADWQYILHNSSTSEGTPITQSIQQLSCCGVQSSADWQFILQNSSDVITYPNSCCGAPVLRQGHYECARVWPNGCLDKLDNLMRSSGRAMLLTALAVAVIQLLGIIFACSLGKLIRLQKSEREKLKWEFRNHLLQTRSAGNFETFVRDNQMENNKL